MTIKILKTLDSSFGSLYWFCSFFTGIGSFWAIPLQNKKIVKFGILSIFFSKKKSFEEESGRSCESTCSTKICVSKEKASVLCNLSTKKWEKMVFLLQKQLQIAKRYPEFNSYLLWIFLQFQAKGLQKLRWYCQMCQKQCRDANGFKCHKMTEGHQRMMKIFLENQSTILDNFSKEFESAMMSLIRRRFFFGNSYLFLSN